MAEINEKITKKNIYKWIEGAFNVLIKPHYDDIKKLEKKLDEDIESRKNWEDAWVKVSNSYLKWNDELKSLSEDFLTLASLFKKMLDTPEVITIPTIFNKSKYLADITALNKQMDLEGEKELPKRENGLNHSHGINSETSVSDSKPPEACKFYNKNYCEPCKSPTDFNKCDLVKIGNQIIIDKFIEQITKATELVGIKPNPEYLNQFTTTKPEENGSTCEDCIIKEEGCKENVVCMFFKPKEKSLLKEQYKKQMTQQ